MQNVATPLFAREDGRTNWFVLADGCAVPALAVMWWRWGGTGRLQTKNFHDEMT
jgi:hypothetical protein